MANSSTVAITVSTAVLLAACGPRPETRQQAAQADRTPPAQMPSDRPPNFLVLIGDDMGVETLSSYGIGTPTAVTPNLDQLTNDGVQFKNF